MSVVIALVDSNCNGQSQHVETKINDKAIRTVCKWQEAKCEQLEVLVSWVYGTIVKKAKPVAVRIKTKSKPLWIAFDIQFKTALVIYSSLLCSIVFTVLSFGIPCHTVLSSSLHCMDYFAFSSEISMFQYKPWWSYSTFKYINVTLSQSYIQCTVNILETSLDVPFSQFTCTCAQYETLDMMVAPKCGSLCTMSFGIVTL